MLDSIKMQVKNNYISLHIHQNNYIPKRLTLSNLGDDMEYLHTLLVGM